MIRRFGLLVLCFTLIGCGDRDYSQALQVVRGVFQPKAEPIDVRAVLTPETLAQVGKPFLIVEVSDTGAQGGLVEVGRNGNVVTWSGPDGSSVSLDRGVLVTTRGIGDDLMAADLSEVHRALFSGASKATRVHSYLNGEEQIERRALLCEYARQSGVRLRTLDRTSTTTRIDETCFSTNVEVQNQYWIDQSGVVRKSLQWISPFGGYLETELVND